MEKLKKYLLGWGPVLVWAGFIFILSSRPNLRAVNDPSLDEVLRTIIHALFYAILSVLVYRALPASDSRCLKALGLSSAYALFDETHQYFVPTRTFQLIDLLVDFLGAVLGVWIIKKLPPKLPPKLNDWAKKLDLV